MLRGGRDDYHGMTISCPKKVRDAFGVQSKTMVGDRVRTDRWESVARLIDSALC